jgi:predicted outer membrane repeat protein
MEVNKQRSSLIICLMLALFLAALAVPAFCQVTIWSVYPGDSIQAAVNAARTGDIVQIHRGTYHEAGIRVEDPNNANAKNITIVGVDGAENTIITSRDIEDGAFSGYIFHFGKGINNSCVLKNLTLTAEYSLDPNDPNSQVCGVSIGAGDGNSDPTIEGNVIVDCGDSGIRIAGVSCSPVLTRNEIYSNYGVDGGGIYFNCVSGTLNLKGNKVHDNFANSYGGGIYFIGEKVSLSVVQSPRDPDFLIWDNEAGVDGGGIYYNATDTLILQGAAQINPVMESDIFLIGNIAGGDGGGMFVAGGTSTVTIQRVWLVQNVAGGYGGGMLLSGGGTTTGTFNLGWIIDNQAQNGGGAYVVGGDLMTFRNTFVEQNQASGYGGGIYSGGYWTKFDSNVIRNNMAYRGGAGCLSYREDFQYNYITDNTALDQDGGFQLLSCIEPRVHDNEFRNNLASSGSGALAILGQTAFGFIGNNLFESNYAGSDTTQGRGAALRVETDEDSYIKIQNNTFVYNEVTGTNMVPAHGAAIYLDVVAPADLANNIIAFNGAGGGVYATETSRPWVFTFNNDAYNNQQFNWGGGYGDMTGINSNISVDPLFVAGRDGHFYLSVTGQTPAASQNPADTKPPWYVLKPQTRNSPCIDAGSITAIAAELTNATTRTDSAGDSGLVDLGFHFRPIDDDGNGVPNLYELSPGIASHYWVSDHPWLGQDEQYFPDIAGDADFDRIEGIGDFDGMTMVQEYRYLTNPQDFDSDADGLADGDEVIVRATDPTNPDTDGDGLTDGDEVNVFHTDPLVANTGIYGFVTSFADGMPVANATMTISQAGDVKLTTVTDSSGAYKANTGPGTFDVLCTKTGFKPQTIAGVLVATGKATVLNFVLEQALGIAGTVTSAADGSAISGAAVQITQGATIIAEIQTDASGTYAAEVPAGTYEITVSHSGYLTQTQSNIEVPEGSLVIVDFALLQATGVTGHVTNSVTRSPVAGATITLSQGGEVIYTTTTGPAGDYSIETDPGTYDIGCVADGYVDAAKPATVVTVGGLKIVNFVLNPSAQVSGRVTNKANGDPIAGASVNFYSQSNGVLLYSATTDPNGNYAIRRNLASGTLSVQVSASGFLSQASLLTVLVGQTYVLNFELSTAPTRLEGNIISLSAGTGISSARIAAYQNGALAASAASNLLGGYSLVLPGPGTYDIIVTATGYSRQQTALTFATGDRLTQDFMLSKLVGSAIVLSSPAVTPSAGTSSTVFQYTVLYQHQSGKLPTKATVVIDGVVKTMTLLSGDPYIGAIYQYSTTLTAKAHTYYFSFGDGTTTKRLPASGSYSGPTVLAFSPITLSQPAANPNTAPVKTTFEFTINYQHSAGKIPTRAVVNIDGTARTMTLVSGNATSGATYRFSTTTLGAKTHKYFFTFSDGKATKRMPITGAYTGPIVTLQ